MQHGFDTMNGVGPGAGFREHAQPFHLVMLQSDSPASLPQWCTAEALAFSLQLDLGTVQLHVVFAVQVSISNDQVRSAFKPSVTDSADNLQAHIAGDDARMSALLYLSHKGLVDQADLSKAVPSPKPTGRNTGERSKGRME